MITGIIAEYNPFHRGHLWHIEQTRASGATCIVAVMSGCTVQRGEFAIAQSTARARMALEQGVDLVIAMPTPWSCARAQDFARAGVHLLKALGCIDAISFGSECGDISLIRRAAAGVGEESVQNSLHRRVGEGSSFAQARQAALREWDPQAAALLRSPNDTLAVEYLSAMRALRANFQPIAIPRRGAGHDEIGGEGFESASELRIIFRGVGMKDEKISSLPSAYLLEEEHRQGRAPVDMQGISLAWMSRLRSMSIDDFARLPDISEGMEHLLYRAVRQGTTLPEIFAEVSNRRYPMARVRRILFHALVGASAADFEELPRFIRVIGCTKTGQELLHRAKNTATLPIITRHAQVKLLPELARRQYALECRAADLMALAMPLPQPCGMEERRQVIAL